MRQIITLTTDFGHEDPYVGIVKGVILSINPDALIVDLSHSIPPQDVLAGAFCLYAGFGSFPIGTMHLAVVDPGVGSDRAMLAIETERGFFIGPDNGLLSWAVKFDETIEASPPHATALVRCIELTNRRYWLPNPSTTFHGRDIFAPVAAQLSLGKPLSELGVPRDYMIQLGWPKLGVIDSGTYSGETANGKRLVATIIAIDRFGNLITNLPGDAIDWDPAHTIIEVAGHSISGLSYTYAGSGLIALLGSADLLEISLPGGNAAHFLGVDRGTTITISSKQGFIA
jgi:S-adenosylmethionine hydrolase